MVLKIQAHVFFEGSGAQQVSVFFAFLKTYDYEKEVVQLVINRKFETPRCNFE